MPSATLETMAGSRSGTLGGFRPPSRLPYPVPRPPAPPIQVPSQFSNLQPPPPPPPHPQFTEGPRPPAGGRGHDIQGRLGESGRPGSWLLQSPFPGGKGFGRLETRDRSLSPQRVREANPVQNGDCLLSPLGKRGRLPSIHRPEGRLLPGARPSLLPEVAPFRLGRIGPPVPSPLLRIIDRPSGLHSGVRHSVGLDPLPWSPLPPVPRRLAGPGLFGGQDRTSCPGPLVAVPLPRDNTQQEVRTGPFHGQWSTSA